REVADELERALDATIQQRVRNVCEDVLPRSGGTAAAERMASAPNGGKSAAAPSKWSIKVDRIAFLDEFEDADFENVDEIVIDIARDHATLLAEKLDRLSARIGR